MKKIVAFLAVGLIACLSFADKMLIDDLGVKTVTITGTGQVIATNGVFVATNGFATITYVTNQVTTTGNSSSNQIVSATNDLAVMYANKTAGSEGWRKIGAIGGYDLEEFSEDTATRGPARDLPTFSYTEHSTNLTVTWSGGDVYDPYTGYHHLASGSKVLVNNAVNYAYWYSNDFTLVQWTTGTRPPADKIYLATFVVSFTNIMSVGTAIAVGDELLYEDVAFANIMPSIITDGILCYATATNLTNIVMSGGTEYHNMGDRIVHPMIDMAVHTQLVYFGHSAAGVWSKYLTNQFPIGICDTGTVISAMDPTMWYRGIFVAPQNTTNKLHFILPDNVYTSAVDALAGTDPDLPPGFDPYIPISTAYIYAGSDTCLRVESMYWQDDRFMIRRGARSTSISGGGGSASTPNLQQVLTAGKDTGGLIPTGLGYPTTDDEVASKGYVDSVRNKASTGTTYVDPVNGDDITGRIEKGSLPFKTIQAAIDACAAAPASDSRRFLVAVSIGTYVENVSMSNYVSVRGLDIESTIIRGTVTWGAGYTDTVGGELQVLSVFSTNAPALVFSAGGDTAYTATRSCAAYSTWTNDAPIKYTVRDERGWLERYGTTWIQIDVVPDGGNSGNTGIVCGVYATTNPANLGTIYANDFCGSYVINCTDTNDIISLVYSDSPSEDYLSFKNVAARVDLSDSINHYNRFQAIYHNGSGARTYMNGASIDLILNLTNNVTIMMNYVGNSVDDGSEAHFNASRIICPNASVSKVWIAAALISGDYSETFNSSVSAATTAYPQRYTVDGAAGSVAYIIDAALGDILLGGGIDMSADNFGAVTPAVGHGRWYAQTTSGFENPYWIDSSGLTLRGFRDDARTMYNLSGSTMYRGQFVCFTQGISGTANAIALADNSGSWSNAAIGVVLSTNIIAGGKGRIMVGGRLESGVDTSYMTAGDYLYLTTAGKITNVPPTTGFVQWVGQCNVVGANGSILVRCFRPDLLGFQIPSYYASNASLISETNRATQAESVIQGQVTTLQGSTSIWNSASVNGISATGRLVVVEGRTSIWNTASSTAIDATNRTLVLEGRTSVWNQAAIDATSATNLIVFYNTAKRFKANVGNANITYAGSLTVTPFTNVVLAASGGSIYSNGTSIAQWWPKATNGVVKLFGSWGAVSANNATYKVHVYKNGRLISDVYNFSAVLNLGNNSMGSTWNFVDTSTPTVNDYYQVYTTFNATRLSVNAGSNNWWYGEVTY